ncbi:MAG: C45 family autoproteolytic acyltransferase/hydrolase [Alistipes sp.]|nr:C45 family autoproteolytic acyltransferase/hydrolase [Alistipes sp.]
MAIALLGLVLLITGIVCYLYFSADMKEPGIEVDLADFPVDEREGYTECNGNMLRRSETGLWEIYLHGDPLERGTAFGRLSRELLYYQEKVFIDQIREFVPSDKYLKFLRFFLVVFNRNLGQAVDEEYRNEIYGVSLSATREFDAIGNPYQRQLNYHAAHDIGHTMQDYMLVGCSAFAVWDVASADSGLLVARNFDFWVGDDFAKNKLVCFFAPTDGYKFASVGWPGMSGVLSGMNEKGLTVTLNAAKGHLPLSSATPISILAREILQYAANIEDAYKIASSRKTFVSESILIGSAEDGSAAVIEKTPRKTELYRSGADRLVVTNHYQSEAFAADKKNIDNIGRSDSRYRFDRLNNLLDEHPPIDENIAAAILRDRMGLGGEDIGLTNEKSINQSIGHHSVIFKPEKRQMWVSTAPWQSGAFVCYDLDSIFADTNFSMELHDQGATIGTDSVFLSSDYPKIIRHRELTAKIRIATKEKEQIDPEFAREYITNNPLFFETYSILGEHYHKTGDYELARRYYGKALEMEIAKASQRERIEKALKKLK